MHNKFFERAGKALMFILKGELLFWSMMIVLACLVTFISSLL